jgi:RHS repeat-associated protein
MVDNYGRVKQYVNYHPFGEVLESWASYDEPLTFTGKQRDFHGAFDFYHFGQRYYDYRIGQFSQVDKAGQFSNGYSYCGNNPISYIDKDGNFAWIPFLIGAAWGAFIGHEYAEAGGKDPGWYMLGGATIGGFAGYAGNLVAQGSFVAPIVGPAASSYINSFGWEIMTNGQSQFSVNFGIGNYNLDQGKGEWADFSGGPLEDISTAMAYMSYSEVYAEASGRLDRLIFGDPEAQEGGRSYSHLRRLTKTNKMGQFKQVDVMKGEAFKWQPWKHWNPLDMVTDVTIHGFDWLLSKIGIGKHGWPQYRYSGGLHSDAFGLIHHDKFDPIYGLNSINHILFEATIRDISPFMSDMLYQTYRNYPYAYNSLFY